jgi:hypothetical protein
MLNSLVLPAAGGKSALQVQLVVNLENMFVPGPHQLCWLVLGCRHADQLLHFEQLSIDTAHFPYIVCARVRDPPDSSKPLCLTAALFFSRIVGADVVQALVLQPKDWSISKQLVKAAPLHAQLDGCAAEESHIKEPGSTPSHETVHSVHSVAAPILPTEAKAPQAGCSDTATLKQPPFRDVDLRHTHAEAQHPSVHTMPGPDLQCKKFKQLMGAAASGAHALSAAKSVVSKVRRWQKLNKR